MHEKQTTKFWIVEYKNSFDLIRSPKDSDLNARRPGTRAAHAKMAKQQRAGGADRLSALPDDMLTHILSHLRSDQAVRTSALSRRWRHVFTAVPVVDIVAAPQMTCPVSINHMVSGVLLSRDSTAPIRSFRVAGFRDDRPSASAIFQWIETALFAGAETLDLDLTMGDQPICPNASTFYQSTAADFARQNFCTMPRRLFTRTTALRHLRLGNCELDLPEPEREQSLSLDTLETLSLKRINAPDHALQRLIAACPRLTELTIEECPTMKRISVALPLLRAFTLRCCHDADHVLVDAPSLRCLGYKGTVAGAYVLALSTWGQIHTLAIDICAAAQANDSDKNRRLREFVERCTNLTALHLSQHDKPPFYPYRAPQTLSGLAQLEFNGPFHIAALVNILQNTSNLQVLTLVIDKLDGDDEASTAAPKRLVSSAVECFQCSLRRIHLVKYNGQDAQRRLAMFLLREAVRTDELQVTFARSVREGSETEALLVSEMVSWQQNLRTKIMFRHE
jgi:hypothetical protein